MINSLVNANTPYQLISVGSPTSETILKESDASVRAPFNTQINDEHDPIANGQNILNALNSDQNSPEYQKAKEKLVTLYQEYRGLETTDVVTFDAKATEHELLQDIKNEADVQGATLTLGDNKGTVLLDSSGNQNGESNTVLDIIVAGHEAGETQYDQNGNGIFFQDSQETKEAMNDALGESLFSRVNEASNNSLTNESYTSESNPYVESGTSIANNLTVLEDGIEYRKIDIVAGATSKITAGVSDPIVKEIFGYDQNSLSTEDKKDFETGEKAVEKVAENVETGVEFVSDGIGNMNDKTSNVVNGAINVTNELTDDINQVTTNGELGNDIVSVFNQSDIISDDISTASVSAIQGTEDMLVNAPVYAKLPLYTASALTFRGIAVPATETAITTAIIYPLQTIGAIEIANDLLNESSPFPSTVKGTVGSLFNNISDETPETFQKKVDYLEQRYYKVKEDLFDEK